MPDILCRIRKEEIERNVGLRNGIISKQTAGRLTRSITSKGPAACSDIGGSGRANG